MLSTRCLAIFALIAAAVALPATEKPIPSPITSITNDDFVPIMPAPWFSVPYFGDITKIFAPLWKLFPSFEDLGPRILTKSNKMQVIVPAKEYEKDDLKVKVKGEFIFVQGTHEAKDAGHDLFASQFFHTYTLPANSSAADVTAELTSDGYLIVNAPLNGNVRSKEIDREVPIVETGVPYNQEELSVASEAPETSEIPETPEVLETPENPDIQEKVPETPEKQPEIPEKQPEVQEQPETPEQEPEVQKQPETPEQQPETPEKQPEVSEEQPKTPASSVSTSEPEIVPEEDRKEPTTPQTDREEVTENDNVIPHGNEINEVTP